MDVPDDIRRLNTLNGLSALYLLQTVQGTRCLPLPFWVTGHLDPASWEPGVLLGYFGELEESFG